MQKKITARKLQALGACSDQVEKFRKLFPEDTEITEALCVQHAQAFAWRWAAVNLLTPKSRKVYNETRATARKVYNETCATARKVYNETCATAFARAYLSPENTEGQT